MRTVLVTGGSGFIGTNYIEHLGRQANVRIINVDIAVPKKKDHEHYWKACDILDTEKLHAIVDEVQPTELVHLAARTDMEGHAVGDYAVNTRGTQSVIQAVKMLSGLHRAIFTSSQYVVGPGPLPAHDEDFRPHTIYGQSKVLSEQIVRSSGLSCCWTIIRPTNVWGNWHPRYPKEFWRVLKAGKYVHPGKQAVTRCYGYVGTVINQIEQILVLPRKKVDRKVFYLGDPRINLLDWVNAFALELTARPARIVPRWVVRCMALVGDGINACGGKFPLFSSRYHSMTEDYDTPMEPTFKTLGLPKTQLNAAVHETVAWLRSQDRFWG